MDNSQSREEAVLRFQVKRNCTLLFKRFLEILERIKDGHDENLDKLRANLPAQYKNYVDLSDDLTDAKMDKLRKEVLGAGNDCIRSIENELGNFDILPKR